MLFRSLHQIAVTGTGYPGLGNVDPMSSVITRIRTVQTSLTWAISLQRYRAQAAAKDSVWLTTAGGKVRVVTFVFPAARRAAGATELQASRRRQAMMGDGR